MNPRAVFFMMAPGLVVQALAAPLPNDAEEHRRIHQELQHERQRAEQLPEPQRQRRLDTLETQHQLFHRQESHERRQAHRRPDADPCSDRADHARNPGERDPRECKHAGQHRHDEREPEPHP